MGRAIMRVPMTFGFPVDKSLADHVYLEHLRVCPTDSTCAKNEHEDAPYWRDAVPQGEGWQLWQTVSDGPLSPVFATPEELIDWMSQPVDRERFERRGSLFRSYEPYPDHPWDQGWDRETAERFVRGPGWMPSMLMVDGRPLTTAEAVKEMEPR